MGRRTMAEIEANREADWEAKVARRRQWDGALGKQRRRERWQQGYVDKYGLSPVQVDKLLLATCGRCTICERRFRGPREPVLDHDHATGKPRGFLCNDCNRGLGDFKDRPQVLVRAARYLTGARL